MDVVHKIFIFGLITPGFIQGKNTPYTSQQTCSPKKFSCDNGVRCIPERWVCDDSPDCVDGTDELKINCPVGVTDKPSTCKSNQFHCANGFCLPYRWTCDGRDDCGDGSDEKPELCKVSCKENEFQCGDDQCITNVWKCDGHRDCSDGTDEQNCPPVVSNKTNLVTEFRCKDGYKIPIAWKCDGGIDCESGEDEENCNVTSEEAHTEEPCADCKKEPEERASRCRKSEVRCPNSYCIPDSWICDGSNDCTNGEDESNCTKIKCNESYQFACKDGIHCIAKQLVCNGVPHCVDQSDELNCTILKETSTLPSTLAPVDDSSKAPKPENKNVTCNNVTEFTCNNGKCIPISYKCDGHTNCPNREDESKEFCGINECDRNNGGCEQKCINTIEGHTCDCANGYILVGKYSCVDIDECTEVPGICSQQCTNTDGSFHCSCLPGYTREPANYTRCRASKGEVYLLFSHSYDIRSLRLRDRDMTSVVQHTRRAIALDYSFVEGKILWSDKKEKKIYRARLEDTEDREVLVEAEEVSADGLAVDWIHNHVYYTDTAKSAIKLLSWDARFVKTIVSEEIGHPRAIVVSPHKGYIYWTDWGSDAKIERASLNGEDRKAIVTSPHVIWPNGLVIDHSTEKIYWCDGRLRTISSANLDGSKIEVILYSPFFLRQPFSISVFEDRLYWTDWSQVALFSADKFTGSNIQNVSAGHMLESPKVVHVYHQYRQPEAENICSKHLCSHFCLRSPLGDALCECADGHVLQDDKISCIEEALILREQFVNSTLENEKDLATLQKKLIQNEMQFKETKSQAGFIIGILLGVLFGVALLVGVYIGWNKVRPQPIQRIRFHNSVYRKTTAEDIDGRGYILDQNQMYFKQQSPSRVKIEQHLSDADDTPLTPEEDDEYYLT